MHRFFQLSYPPLLSSNIRYDSCLHRLQLSVCLTFVFPATTSGYDIYTILGHVLFWEKSKTIVVRVYRLSESFPTYFGCLPVCHSSFCLWKPVLYTEQYSLYFDSFVSVCDWAAATLDRHESSRKTWVSGEKSGIASLNELGRVISLDRQRYENNRCVIRLRSVWISQRGCNNQDEDNFFFSNYIIYVEPWQIEHLVNKMGSVY